MLSRVQTISPSSSRLRRQSAIPTWQIGLGWALLTLPVLVFGWVWQQYAVNVPKWDDHALRGFLINVDQETTIAGKIYQLFRQHNEHRIVYDRILTLLDYTLFGKLNYVHLMAVGNLSLVGLLAIFVAVLRRNDSRAGGWPALYAVPVALLLFNLSQWENMFWGMAALQNFSVVLWVLWAVFLLTHTNRWPLAVLAGVLATITSGNGLLVWPLGLLMLLLRVPTNRPGRPSWWPLLGWAVGAILTIGLYFVGFEKPGGAHAIRPGVIDLLKGWFVVVGAAAEALPVGTPLRNSMLLGGLIVLVTLGIAVFGLLTNWPLLVRTVQQRRDSSRLGGRAGVPVLLVFFWGSAGFLLGTAAIVAYARTGFGIDLLMTSRYKLYSLTLLALLYTYLIAILPTPTRRWTGLAGGVASLGLAWLSYVTFLDETIWWRHWLTTNQFNWHHPTNRPVAQLDPVTNRYTNPAPAFYDAILPVIYGPARSATLNVAIRQTPVGFTLSENTVTPQGLLDEGAYLLVRSPKRLYLFPTWQNRNSSLTARLVPGKPFANGFRADLNAGELAAGTYQLFVLIVPQQPAAPYLLGTNRTITPAGPPTDTTEKNW